MDRMITVSGSVRRLGLRVGAAALLLLLLLPRVSAARDGYGYRDYALAEDTGQARRSRVALLHEDLSVVAWQDREGRIRSKALLHFQTAGEFLHGVGKDPTLFFLGTDCMLAYAAGTGVIVKTGDGLNWDNPSVLTSGAGHATANPDFGHNPAGAELYLVWEEGSDIYWSQRLSGQWQPPRIVCSDGAGIENCMPQIEPFLYQGIPEPRVYYRSGTLSTVHYREYDGQAWSAPIQPTQFLAFGERFDVDFTNGYAHAVLSLGIPGACPCNVVLYTEELSGGGWSLVDNLTDYQSEVTLCLYPGLAGDRNGILQAFWYELFKNEGGEIVGEELYWKTRAGGQWLDQPEDFFGDRIGGWGDVAVAPADPEHPSFVWIEPMAGGGSRVVLHHYGPVAGMLGDGPSGALLAITPNPFSDRTVLRWHGHPGEAARLELFDLFGRPVRRWSRPGSFGLQSVLWDGRDADGAPLPAGVYYLRLSHGQSATTRPVVRIR